MGVPFSQADFLAEFQALMPRGRVWPRDPDALHAAVLNGWAAGYARQTADDLQLLIDAFPATADPDVLLVDWEQTLGLDPGNLDVAHRRAQVVYWLTSIGGQSRPYFVALAALMWGFLPPDTGGITITEFWPDNCERDCETPVYGDPWAFVWRLNMPATLIHDFTCENNTETPLRWWNNVVFEEILRKYAPAHTVPQFAYGS